MCSRYKPVSLNQHSSTVRKTNPFKFNQGLLRVPPDLSHGVAPNDWVEGRPRAVIKIIIKLLNQSNIQQACKGIFWRFCIHNLLISHTVCIHNLLISHTVCIHNLLISHTVCIHNLLISHTVCIHNLLISHVVKN